MNLAQRHPDYVATESCRIKARDLYEGGEAVKAKSTTYLFQEKNEDDDAYKLRLKRAVLDNFVEKIVVSRQAILFAKPHTRHLPESLESLADDVDMKGMSAAVFFEQVAKEAQIDGIAWVLVDMPQLPVENGVPSEFRTKRDETLANHRPFMQLVPASAVIDWEVGSDQQLNWVVIEESLTQPRMPGDALKFVKRWKVWTRESWTVYELNAQSNKSVDTRYSVVAEGPNPTNHVPLVPFYGIKRNDFSGWPVARSVLDHVIAIYNKESDLDWFERLFAHPVPYAIAPTNPKKMDVSGGLWIQSEPNSGEIEVGYLQTSGAGEGSIRESITNLTARILSIALAQAKRDTAQVQSADGQREDRRIFTTSLKGISLALEFSEYRVWELVSMWLGETSSEIDIIYNRDFDDTMVEAQMLTALMGLADANKLSTETLLTILKEGEVLPVTVDVEEELERINSQGAAAAVKTLRELKREQAA